jgi:dipeptidyl aminopeptidase/acylaminoacyl peptidase
MTSRIRRLMVLGTVAALPSVTACDDTTRPEDPIEPAPRIVFSTYELEGFGPGIFRVRLDGSDLEQISALAGAGNLTVSPDADRIAFHLNESGNPGSAYNIHVLDADGTDRRLTDYTSDDLWPAWSPDGSSLAFTSIRGGRSAIYVMNPDGSGQRQLTEAVDGDARLATWSGAGDRIAYVVLTPATQAIFIRDVEAPSAPAGVPRRLIDEAAYSLDWRPGYEELAGLGPHDPNGNAGVVRIESDGDVFSLTPAAVGALRSARWSPDGDRLAYIARSAGQDADEIRIMDADGRNVTVVPIPPVAVAISVDWLP